MLRQALLWTSCLHVGEPVVPRRVWFLLMKLLEFLQTTYRTVVQWLFHPVLAFRIVEPFDQIEDSLVFSPAVFD